MLVRFGTPNAWSRCPSRFRSYLYCSSLSASSELPHRRHGHSHSHDDDDDVFLPWLRRKSGLDISSLLSIKNSSYGRSLFASTAIRAGDCILQVPFSVQLTPDMVLPEIDCLLGDDIGNVTRLALVILVEQRLGQESEWAPYIRSLPRPGESHSTIFWSEEELEMVQQSSIYKETYNQLTQIEKEFVAIRPVLDCFPQYFDGISLSIFMHAYALVGSRAWGSPKGLSLVPFADFLNHDGVSEAVLLSNEGKQISEVIADRDYIDGEQVLIRYGKFPNSTLLLDFGFTLPYNVHDQIHICIDVPKHDSLFTMKVDLLHQYYMPIIQGTNSSDPSQNSFIIKEVRSARGKGKGIPQSLRAVARVLCASSAQELKDLVAKAEKSDGRLARCPMKNTKREIQAHHFLNLQILQLIQKYETSIKLLGCTTNYSNTEHFALRRQMAWDLLSGELRVLKSASAWLSNYCNALSMGNYHPTKAAVTQ
ncbi:hypothetical protein Sjap_013282 [Stephania japonica]|uniref:Rubisco LSMT substrate-binding domain-containing protein n=1 Tax=Stephania japonica TaxID=461633 RepID=A0AAP0IYF0_9MAGN